VPASSLPSPLPSPGLITDQQFPEDAYHQQQTLPPQQTLLLGGMLQGWPAAVLAPDSLLPAAAAVLETVRPDPHGPPESDEYRLGVALLPIRLRLNQDLVSFLVLFFGSVADAVAAVENPLTAAVAATSAAAGATDGSRGGVDGSTAAPASSGVQPPFFQKVVIWGTGVCVHYCPRRVDIAALRDGDFLELLNLVPWGGVDLNLKPLRFTGVVGWDGLAAGLASEWLGYVAKTQAHKFLAGVAPIRSVIQVSSAVATLLSGPAASLQKALGGAVTAAAAAGKAGAAVMWQQGGSNGVNGLSTRQQLQNCLQAAAAAAAAATGSSSAGGKCGAPGRRGFQETMAVSVQGFARSLLYEAMGVGASVASGAQAFMAGPAAGQGSVAAAPTGLVQGLRAAATEVTGGFQEAAAVLAQGARAQLKQGDYVTAAREVLKVAPAAAAAPVRGFAAGVRTVLRGNQAVPASAVEPEEPEQEQQEG
jgi:autophagy-related protein 2